VHDGIMVLSYAFLAATHLGYCTCTVMNTPCEAGFEFMLTVVQAVKAAAENAGLPLCIFSPALLRCAGNIVNADEVEQVLSYAISDKQFSDLHNLYLIGLANQPAVVQLASDQPALTYALM